MPFKIRDRRIGKPRTEFLRLLMHVDDELRAIDALRKSGKIFHHCRRGKLTARLPAFEDERIKIRARGINRGGQPRASAPDDDHLLHR